MGDKFSAAGLDWAMDGADPELILTLLETWMSSLMHEHEVKYRKVMEGIVTIQSGEHPRIVFVCVLYPDLLFGILPAISIRR